MCSHENCDRHEYDGGLCLPHLKEKYGLISFEKPRKSRRKKVDAEEVTTNDDTTEMETREGE